MALGDTHGIVSVYNTQNKRRIAHSSRLSDQPVRVVVSPIDFPFSSDQQWLAIAWEVGWTGEILSLKSGHSHKLPVGGNQTCITFSRCGRHVLFGYRDGRITLVTFDTRSKTFSLENTFYSLAWQKQGAIQALDFSSVGESLTVGFAHRVYLLRTSDLGIERAAKNNSRTTK
jgi:hypothetical protein